MPGRACPCAGERITMKHRVVQWECCDCGLVHIIRFRLIGNKISFAMWRDNPSTAQTRRRRREKEGSDESGSR